MKNRKKKTKQTETEKQKVIQAGNIRSSCPEVFCKRFIFKNITKFTWESGTLLTKTPHRCVSLNFGKFKKPVFDRTAAGDCLWIWHFMPLVSFYFPSKHQKHTQTICWNAGKYRLDWLSYRYWISAFLRYKQYCTIWEENHFLIKPKQL